LTSTQDFLKRLKHYVFSEAKALHNAAMDAKTSYPGNFVRVTTITPTQGWKAQSCSW
jgi:hypothetical protein